MDSWTRKPLIERTMPGTGSEQRLYRFGNNFGASVVRGTYTYGGGEGLWELAVIRWGSAAGKPEDFNLTYDTPITNDVIGHLAVDEVEALLDQIEALESVNA